MRIASVVSPQYSISRVKADSQPSHQRHNHGQHWTIGHSHPDCHGHAHHPIYNLTNWPSGSMPPRSRWPVHPRLIAVTNNCAGTPSLHSTTAGHSECCLSSLHYTYSKALHECIKRDNGPLWHALIRAAGMVYARVWTQHTYIALLFWTMEVHRETLPCTHKMGSVYHVSPFV